MVFEQITETNKIYNEECLQGKYIGFEQDEEYYEIAQERVSEVQKELI